MNKRACQIAILAASIVAACAAQLPTSWPTTVRTISSTTTTSSPTTTTTAPAVLPTSRHDPVPPPPAPPTQPTTVPAVMPVVSVPVVLPNEPLDDRIKLRLAWEMGDKLHQLFQQTGNNPDDYRVIEQFLKGLQGAEPSYSKEDMRQAVAQLLARMRQRQAEKLYADDPAFRKLAEENMQSSRSTLELFGQTAGFDAQPDGALVRVDKPGDGRIVATAKSLTMVVRTSLADGTVVSSSNGPVKVPTTDVLPAVLDVCRGMKVGGKFRVVLPPDKAYGLAGRPPVIGPNRAVVFDIELIAAE